MISARILVVDDEVGLGLVVRDLLELEGYDVTLCHGIASAREVLARGDFEVAMVDVFLSEDPTGLDLARHIAANCPDTGVILMTGYADQASTDEACRSIAHTCISKPFSLDDMVRVVESALFSRQIGAA
ncbi:MAG: response regulator [Armatimonadota bacterium]